MRASVRILLVLALLPAFSCNTVGPRVVGKGRFNYNEAISDSANEQLLLNLVRQAHLDPQLMLEISDIVAQYEIHYEAGAEAGSEDAVEAAKGLIGALKVFGDAASTGSELTGTRDRTHTTTDTASANAGITYTESPNITYKPLQGPDYAARLLKNVDPANVAKLSQTMWGLQSVFLVAMDGWSFNEPKDEAEEDWCVGCPDNKPDDKKPEENKPQEKPATGPTRLKNLPIDFARNRDADDPKYNEYVTKQFKRFAEFINDLDTLERYGLIDYDVINGKPGQTKTCEITKECESKTEREKVVYTIPESQGDPLLKLDADEIEKLRKDENKKVTDAADRIAAFFPLDPKAPGYLEENSRPDSALKRVQFNIRQDSLGNTKNPSSAATDVPYGATTRSLLDIFQFLSQCIDTRDRQNDNTYVMPGLTAAISLSDIRDDRGADKEHLFLVQHSRLYPADAFVRVRYKGEWYYISDNDTQSKKVFNLLSNLVQLQSAEVKDDGTVKAINL